MNFVAVKKYKDGGEAIHEYFDTKQECLAWILKQPQPEDDSWQWCIGEY